MEFTYRKHIAGETQESIVGNIVGIIVALIVVVRIGSQVQASQNLTS